MPGKFLIFLRASLLTLFITSLVVFLAMAATNGFSIPWWTMDGGGGTSQGGDYSLQGTIGQPDAGSPQGGDFSLAGGFWAGIKDRIWQFFIHLPLVMR